MSYLVAIAITVAGMGQFSAKEQYFLELVNRARMDPSGEALRFGIALNQGLASGTISSASKQVLAANALLHDAAQLHSDHMLAVDKFNHSGIGDGDMVSRVDASGYSWNTIGENIAWTSQNSISLHHENLFKSAGHRENILGGAFKEVGIASSVGTFNYSGFDWSGSLMTTQNFGANGSAVFVTGVSYLDNVLDDNFYSVGEAATGRTITLYHDGGIEETAETEAAGGYGISTSVSGNVEIVFEGDGLADPKGASFILGSSNVKIDIVDTSTIEANVSITLTQGSHNARLLGVDGLSAKGNALNNKLYGNSGNNKLAGKSGNDKLYGGQGNDELRGGIGADTLHGSSGADKFVYASPNEGGDKIISYDSTDSFRFEGSTFGLGNYSGVLPKSRFHSGATNKAKDTSDRFIFRTTDDTLWYDSNGSNAGGTRTMIADFSMNVDLTAADIWIV
jgi:Ca2+-binding RTX toxin-like protein